MMMMTYAISVAILLVTYMLLPLHYLMVHKLCSLSGSGWQCGSKASSYLALLSQARNLVRWSSRDGGIRRMEGSAEIGISNCTREEGSGLKIQSTVVRNSLKSRAESPFWSWIVLSKSWEQTDVSFSMFSRELNSLSGSNSLSICAGWSWTRWSCDLCPNIKSDGGSGCIERVAVGEFLWINILIASWSGSSHLLAVQRKHVPWSTTRCGRGSGGGC